MPTCTGCGSDVNEGVKFCPKCGQPTAAAASSSAPSGAPGGSPGGYAGADAAASPAAGSASVDNQNVMGALAYVTIIPAILFLVIEPYNKNRFVRFHSFQCLFLALASFVLSIANMMLGAVLAFIPVVGWILSLIIGIGIPIGILVLWVLALFKAYQGEEYKLPVIGDFAAKQA